MTTGTNSLTGTMDHKCKSVFELNNINIFMKTNSLMFKSIQRVSVMLVINRIR